MCIICNELTVSCFYMEKVSENPIHELDAIIVQIRTVKAESEAYRTGIMNSKYANFEDEQCIMHNGDEAEKEIRKLSDTFCKKVNNITDTNLLRQKQDRILKLINIISFFPTDIFNNNIMQDKKFVVKIINVFNERQSKAGEAHDTKLFLSHMSRELKTNPEFILICKKIIGEKFKISEVLEHFKDDMSKSLTNKEKEFFSTLKIMLNVYDKGMIFSDKGKLCQRKETKRLDESFIRALISYKNRHKQIGDNDLRNKISDIINTVYEISQVTDKAMTHDSFIYMRKFYGFEVAAEEAIPQHPKQQTDSDEETKVPTLVKTAEAKSYKKGNKKRKGKNQEDEDKAAEYNLKFAKKLSMKEKSLFFN